MRSSPDGKPLTTLELRAVNRARVRRILQTALIHDLKAPLNTATLVLDLLSRSLAHEDSWDGAGRTGLIENVEEVRRELRRLSEALPSLLSLADPGEEEARPLDLAASLQEGLHLLRQQILLRGVRLHRCLPSGPVMVDGRPSDLQHAFINVILNALEASKRGGEVHVRLERDGDGPVRVRVEDAGEGLPEDLLERAFEPRFTRRDGHDGYGLPVARGILEEHGGSIRLIRGPGGGTVVAIELPPAASLPQRAALETGTARAGTPSPEVGA